MILDKPLTNLQLELLRLFSLELSDEELRDVRRLLAQYFAERATEEMDRLWEEQGWTKETIQEWLAGNEGISDQ